MVADKPRVAILGMHLESNQFAPVTTGDDFRASCYFEGEDILAEACEPAPAMPAEVPAFIQDMDAAGDWQAVPILITSVEPGGPAEQAFVDECLAKMRTGLSAALPIDAVYISNHGAMTSTGDWDPDGELYAMVRAVVGPDVPVVSTVDLHANISERMVDSVDAIVAYRTNPHVDQRERAAEAAGLLRRMMQGEKFESCFIRMPIVAPSTTLLSARGAYADMIDAGQAMIGPDLPLVSAVGGFAFGDTPKNGIAIITYGTGSRPRRAALELAHMAWSERERFRPTFTSVEDAVRQALDVGASDDGPAICLADVADNPGGGARGNTTDILEGLLEARVQRTALGNFVDPALAQACHAQGEGAEFEAVFNRDNADEFGRRVTTPIQVLKLSDGWVVGRRGIAQGRSVNLGPSAAVRAGGLTIVVCSRRIQCADPVYFESFGLDIREFRSVTVKSRGHFRAGFDEFFEDDQILEVDAGGLTSPVLSRFDFKRLPRPVYPLDPETRWLPPSM
jgi:microcystin degradation protein MlrC